MITAEPLILVLSFLVTLWLIGVRLNKANSPSHIRRRTSAHGTEITPYLHAVGLKEYQSNELKAIVTHNDELALKKFIAYYRPGFVELDSYIGLLRHRFLDNLGKPLTRASDIEKIAAANRLSFDDQPSHYDFTILSKSEVRILLEFGANKGAAVDEEFVRQFGDSRYLENFNAYKQLRRDHDGTLYVPKKDTNRPLLEMLANHGVVLKGRRIELKDRLRILSLKQLNDMSRELKIRKTFQSQEHAVHTLAQAPGSAILLAMIYAIDDLFYLNPRAVDVEAVDRELEAWSVYAKLIAWPAKQTASNLALTQSL